MRSGLATIVPFSAMLALSAPAALLDYPVATVAVTVVDENQRPVEGALVTGIFNYPKTFSTYNTKLDKQKTDAMGRVVVSGRTDTACGIDATKDGCYMSGRSVSFASSENGNWLPSPRAETLVLRKIGSPVPMYAAANWAIELPERKGAFGFDLEKHDWVAPHGAGVKPDLVFTQETKEDVVNGSTATLRISFSNPGDGLIPIYELHAPGSHLRLPRNAPAEGYETERRITTSWSLSRQHTPPPQPALGYIYRVRTVLDEKGQVKSAWYGKINREFKWDSRNFRTAQITFTYYLNPDGTTNLEFDPKRNLIRDLPGKHTVEYP